LHSSSSAFLSDGFESDLQLAISNLSSVSLIYFDASLCHLLPSPIPYPKRMKLHPNQSFQIMLSIWTLIFQS
jgi:hypothetical protein